MGTLLHFNRFAAEPFWDASYRNQLFKMTYEEIMEQVVLHKNARAIGLTQNNPAIIKRGLTLFAIVKERARDEHIVEVAEMYINHLMQELRLLKGTYK